MPIEQHPGMGAVITCDFNMGEKTPEMEKNFPVVVICPSTAWRTGLCTVVGLSTSPPDKQRPYCCRLDLCPPLPAPWAAEMWVRGDLVAAVRFDCLNLIPWPHEDGQNQQFRMNPLSANQIKVVRDCVLNSIGVSMTLPRRSGHS